MKSKINPFWGILTLALVVLTLVLCVIGNKTGVLLVKTDANPYLAADSFFEAVQVGKYDVIKANMENYSSLGLENTPVTEAGKLEWDALLASYRFTLQGVPTVTQDIAVQTVEIRYLDLNALEAAVLAPQSGDEEAPGETGEGGETAAAPASEADGEAEEETDAAAAQARAEALARLRELLEQPEEYYTTVVLPVTLHYVDGQWLVQVDDALLTALSGGKA